MEQKKKDDKEPLIKPIIPTLRDSKPMVKIQGLPSATSLFDRLKQFKKKDLTFILAGLGVLFMAPLAEHFMMAPETGDSSGAFKEGWGFRDGAGGLGRGGSPYEPGVSGLAPGSLLGGGADVITPLNVRDPSALVMGPGSTQPTPVSAPAPAPSAAAPSKSSSNDWKDALANAASRAAPAASARAALPVPKIPLQGALRGLGAVSGGGGGSFSLAPISAANVANRAADSNSLQRVVAPTGFKGAASSRGSNSPNTDGLAGLKAAASNAADFNRGGSAVGSLDTAAQASQALGGGGADGGAGAGGASAADKGASQNSAQGSRNQGESLAFLMAKTRMEKDLEMAYKKAEKADTELLYYDIRNKAITDFASKALVDPISSGVGKFIYDPDKGWMGYGSVWGSKAPAEFYACDGDGRVPHYKSAGFCITGEGGLLGNSKGAKSDKGDAGCTAIVGEGGKNITGCHTYQDSNTEDKPAKDKEKEENDKAVDDAANPTGSKLVGQTCENLRKISSAVGINTPEIWGNVANDKVAQGKAKSIADAYAKAMPLNISAGVGMTGGSLDAGKCGATSLNPDGKATYTIQNRLVDSGNLLTNSAQPIGVLDELQNADNTIAASLDTVKKAEKALGDDIAKKLADLETLAKQYDIDVKATDAASQAKAKEEFLEMNKQVKAIQALVTEAKLKELTTPVVSEMSKAETAAKAVQFGTIEEFLGANVNTPGTTGKYLINVRKALEDAGKEQTSGKSQLEALDKKMQEDPFYKTLVEAQATLDKAYAANLERYQKALDIYRQQKASLLDGRDSRKPTTLDRFLDAGYAFDTTGKVAAPPAYTGDKDQAQALTARNVGKFGSDTSSEVGTITDGATATKAKNAFSGTAASEEGGKKKEATAGIFGDAQSLLTTITARVGATETEGEKKKIGAAKAYTVDQTAVKAQPPAELAGAAKPAPTSTSAGIKPGCDPVSGRGC